MGAPSKELKKVVEGTMDGNAIFQDIEEASDILEKTDAVQDKLISLVKKRARGSVVKKAIEKYQQVETLDDSHRELIACKSRKGQGLMSRIAQIAESLIGTFRYRKAA